MKKYLLAVTMVLSLFATQLAYADIAPEPTPPPKQISAGSNVFTDVTPNSKYYNALLYLKNQGVIDGYPDGSFKPNNTINRAEFTKIIIGVTRTTPDNGLCTEDYANQDGSYKNMFTDIPLGLKNGDPWYVNDICVAKDLHLIDGYPDGSFKPEAKINFVEAAKIIANAFNMLSDNSPGPGASTEAWYKDYVVVLGNVNAIPTTIITFNQKITRGEMAEMAFRLKTKNTSLSSKTYSDLK